MNSKTLQAVLIAAAATTTGMILYDLIAPKIKKMLHLESFEDEDYE